MTKIEILWSSNDDREYMLIREDRIDKLIKWLSRYNIKIEDNKQLSAIIQNIMNIKNERYVLIEKATNELKIFLSYDSLDKYLQEVGEY